MWVSSSPMRRHGPVRRAGQLALRHVDAVVEPGQTLALVGATGSGKSVLAALFSRLYDVTEGQILIDGRDIRELSLPVLCVRPWPRHSRIRHCSRCRWPRTCGWAVPMPPTKQLAQAIEIAAAQFVYDLPFGLDTRIGEQGMSLSGGQRQRLSLARAILAAPKILVLDDTLSALDVHTEAVVTEALGRVLRGVTGIIVAHRASTVLLADKVALLHAVDSSGAATITHIGTHMPNCWRRYRNTAICWPPMTNSTTRASAVANGRTTRSWAGCSAATTERTAIDEVGEPP